MDEKDEKKIITLQEVKSEEGITIPKGTELLRVEFNDSHKYIANINQYRGNVIGVTVDGLYADFNPFLFRKLEQNGREE